MAAPSPSLPEWLTHADSLQWPHADASAAFDYYLACGWKQARGNPIKDWRAGVRNCHRRVSGINGRSPPPARSWKRVVAEAALRTESAIAGIIPAEDTTLSFGFPDLDRNFHRLRRKEVCVIAARPSCGKSSLTRGDNDAQLFSRWLKSFLGPLEM